MTALKSRNRNSSILMSVSILSAHFFSGHQKILYIYSKVHGSFKVQDYML